MFRLPDQTYGKICCDNQSSLFKAKWYRKRVPPGAKPADLLRALGSLHHKLGPSFTYEHVYGHQDKFKLLHQLTIEAQLTC